MMAKGDGGGGDRATYQIRALDRGLDVLEAFSLTDPELTIGQIGERTGLPKPTVVRLLSVLADRGYVERVEGVDRYRLGVRSLEIGSVYLHSTSLESEARPIMRRLAADTGQTANLGILHASQVVHIEVVAPDRPVRFWAMIGKREDAHVSGLGKVLLAALPAPERDAYLAQPLLPLTPSTITDPERLRAELQLTAARGYAIDHEESNDGVLCIAAPIRDRRGEVEAALSISGPRAEFEADGQMERLIAMVRTAADEISARLGWREGA